MVSENRARLIREVIETITFTLLIMLVIRFAVQSYLTEGPSMEPGIHQNEYLLVSKAVYLFQQPQRGDVVVFHYPLDIHKDFIKRIIGIPGDTIQITKTTVSINGRIIVEPYTSHPFTYDRNTWKLGSEQFFVMGDNRDNSFDLRDWGPLERSYIVGKVVAIYWPLPDWSFINTYPSVYAAIPMPK